MSDSGFGASFCASFYIGNMCFPKGNEKADALLARIYPQAVNLRMRFLSDIFKDRQIPSALLKTAYTWKDLETVLINAADSLYVPKIFRVLLENGMTMDQIESLRELFETSLVSRFVHKNDLDQQMSETLQKMILHAAEARKAQEYPGISEDDFRQIELAAKREDEALFSDCLHSNC